MYGGISEVYQRPSRHCSSTLSQTRDSTGKGDQWIWAPKAGKLSPVMVDPDITVGAYVYAQRRNIPGGPLKEGGRGKVPPSRAPLPSRRLLASGQQRLFAGLDEAVLYIDAMAGYQCVPRQHGGLVLDVKYVLTPSVHGASQRYRTRRLRGLYSETVTRSREIPEQDQNGYPLSPTPPPHLHRDRPDPCHICTGTGLTPGTSAAGLGSAPTCSQS